MENDHFVLCVVARHSAALAQGVEQIVFVGPHPRRHHDVPAFWFEGPAGGWGDTSEVLADHQHVVVPRHHQGHDNSRLFRAEQPSIDGVRFANGVLGLGHAQAGYQNRRHQRQRNRPILAHHDGIADRGVKVLVRVEVVHRGYRRMARTVGRQDPFDVDRQDVAGGQLINSRPGLTQPREIHRLAARPRRIQEVRSNHGRRDCRPVGGTTGENGQYGDGGGD